MVILAYFVFDGLLSDGQLRNAGRCRQWMSGFVEEFPLKKRGKFRKTIHGKGHVLAVERVCRRQIEIYVVPVEVLPFVSIFVNS